MDPDPIVDVDEEVAVAGKEQHEYTNVVLEDDSDSMLDGGGGEDGRGEGTRGGGRWGEGEAKTINILRGTAEKLKHLEINLKLLRFPVMSKRKKRREHSQKLTMF